MRLEWPGPDAYTSLFEHAHVWKDPGRFTLSVSVQLVNGTENMLLQHICWIRTTFRELLKEVRDRGAKTGFALVTTARDRTALNTGLEKHIESFEAGRSEDNAQHEQVLDLVGHIRADMWQRWVDSVKAYHRKQKEREGELTLKSTAGEHGGDLRAGSSQD